MQTVMRHAIAQMVVRQRKLFVDVYVTYGLSIGQRGDFPVGGVDHGHHVEVVIAGCDPGDDQRRSGSALADFADQGGDPAKVFDIPSSINITAGLRWTTDGRALTYIDTTGGVSNIWSLPLDGGKSVQLTDFKADQIFWFDFSRDGKQLALSRGTQTSDVVLIRDVR